MFPGNQEMTNSLLVHNLTLVLLQIKQQVVVVAVAVEQPDWWLVS